MEKILFSCEWQGCLTSINQEKSTMYVHALRRQQDSGSWTLEREREESVEGACIQACKVAVDEKRGTKNLFLLTIPRWTASTSRMTASSLFSLTMLSTTSESSRRMVYHCEHAPTESNPLHVTPEELGNVSILDGPVVVLTEGKHLHMLYTVDHSHKLLQWKYDVENLISDGYQLKKVNDAWPFRWQEERDIFDVKHNSLVVFLKLKVMSDLGRQSITEWVCLLVLLRPQHHAVKLLQVSKFIPCDYGRISTCLAMHNSYSASLTSGDIVSKCQFLVGTEYRQVVLFHCGTLLRCVALTFIPQNLVLLDNQSGQLSFACCSQTGETSAYQISEEGVQVVGEWEGVHQMVVGDFANLGHEQLLLLFSDSVSDFLVTDLEQFNTSSKHRDEEEMTTDQHCAESLIGVVNALHLRKHKGDTYLTGIKTELQMKTELLKKSLSFLMTLEWKQRNGRGEKEDSQLSQPALHSDPSLVCIIPGEVPSPEPASVSHTVCGNQRHPQPPLKLERLWQRLKDELWVIGVVIQNQASEDISDIKLTIAPIKSCSSLATNCSSRVVWIEQTNMFSSSSSPSLPSSTGSPPLKRKKVEEPFCHLLEGLMEDGKKLGHSGPTLAPGMKIIVVLSTSVPAVGSSGGGCEESVMIVASWRKMIGERDGVCSCQEEVGEIGTACLTLQLLCSGDFNLNDSCLSLWNGKPTLSKQMIFEERRYQDLACVLGISSFVLVEASSSHTNLLCLPAKLRAQLPLKSNAIITESTEGQCNGSQNEFEDSVIQCDHIHSHSLDVLEGVAVHVSPKANSARIAVLFRSTRQLCLLMSAMRQCLPIDISLQMLTDTKWCVSLQASLTSILEEAKEGCSSVECRMNGVSPKGDNEQMAELRDKTDLKISVVTRS